MKTKDDSVKTHVDKFYKWLCSFNFHGNKHVICKAVAEKANILMDGIYSDQMFLNPEVLKVLKETEAEALSGTTKGTRAKA